MRFVRGDGGIIRVIHEISGRGSITSPLARPNLVSYGNVARLVIYPGDSSGEPMVEALSVDTDDEAPYTDVFARIYEDLDRHIGWESEPAIGEIALDAARAFVDPYMQEAALAQCAHDEAMAAAKAA